MPSHEVSTDELIAAAREAGYPITVTALKRWHREGVIPSPRTVSLGRGRGTASLYAPNTVGQLLAALEFQRADRRLDRVRWRLWWVGYPVPIERISSFIKHVLEPADEQLREFRNLSDEERLDLIEKAAGGPRQFSPRVRRAHKRLHYDRFVSMLSILGNIATGDFTGFRDEEDAELLLRGSELTETTTDTIDGVGPIASRSDYERTLSGLSSVLRGTRLVDLVDDMSDRLCTVRDDIGRVLPVFAAASELFQARPGRNRFGIPSMASFLSSLTPEDQAVITFCWALNQPILQLHQGVDEFMHRIEAEAPHLTTIHQAANSSPPNYDGRRQ